MAVYYIKCETTGLVKIGLAVKPISRLSNLQVGVPGRLILLATEPGGRAREAQVHEQFKAHRMRGEWFRLEPEVVDYIKCLEQYVPPKKYEVQDFGGSEPIDLRSLRKERLRLSQAELARQLGITQGTVSRFETGVMPLDERTKLAVEALLQRQAA